MAGLLGDVLPWVYSQGDRAKRYVGGLLSDPIGSMQQTAGLLQDYRREDQRLNAQAFADQSQPFRVTDKRAMTQLADRAMAGPLGVAPVGMTAWHGTPHKFDKFDSSKIGTGEGAQAYGHGLYLAESPDTARHYASAVTSQRVGLGSIDGRPMADLSKAEKGAVMELKLSGGDVEKAIKALQSRGPGYESVVAERLPILQQIAAGRKAAELARGNLYKVDLPDSAVAKMLDWDKPLSQQPDMIPRVREALAAKGFEPWQIESMIGRDITGEQVNAFVGGIGGQAKAPEYLRKAGIPGIRYLDGGSRGAGQGSSNFVVFPGEEGALNILERNGQPLK